MAKVNTILYRARYMKEIGLMIRSMALVNRLIRWGKSMMDNGVTIRGMEKGYILLPMEISIKDHGKMDQNFDFFDYYK